jgi:hypothetical protein
MIPPVSLPRATYCALAPPIVIAKAKLIIDKRNATRISTPPHNVRQA